MEEIEKKGDQLTEKEKTIMNEWFQMRQRIVIFAYIQRTIFIFEYASTAISALFYYKLMIQPTNPVLFYSISIGIIYLSASVSSILGGWYVDKTGRLREFHIFVNLFSIVGNFIYSVPYSKWFPVIGRLMSGIADGAQPGLGGDVSRSFKQKEQSILFSNMAIFGGVASVLAPCSVVVFTSIDFYLFGMHINKYNFIGIFMSIVMILYTIGCLFFLPNCTLHPGYQIFVNKIKKKEKKMDKSSTTKSIVSTKSILTVNIAFVILAGFMCGFTYPVVEINTNLVAMYIFEWSLSKLSIVSLICAIVSIVFMKYIQRYDGIVDIFFMLIMSVAASNVIICIQLVTINIKFETKFIQIAVMMSLYFVNTITGYNTASWVRYILFSLSPSQLASTIDGFRFFFYCIGHFSGFFVASYFFLDEFYGFSVTSIVCLLVTTGLIFRKRHIIEKSLE